MGYESRLYVVNKTDYGFERYFEDVDKELKYAECIAQFELCKVYDVSSKMRKYPDTDCYTYDGDEEVIEDKYGSPLKEIPIADAIAIIEEEAESDGYAYRRWKPCLGLLKGFDAGDWENLVVLHYGH